MQTYYYQVFGQVYGAGGYDTTTYGGETTSSDGGNAGSSALTNTGIAVAGIVTIAAIILLVAIVVRIWKRPRRQVALEPVEIDDTEVSSNDGAENDLSR